MILRHLAVLAIGLLYLSPVVAASKTVLLDDGSGTTTFALKGYDWRFLTIPTPSASTVDIVLTLDRTSDEDIRNNCDGWHILADFKPTVPEVQPRSTDASTLDTSSIWSDVLGLLHRSFFCRTQPQLLLSVKSTEPSEQWHLLVQTYGGAESLDETKCWVTINYNVASRGAVSARLLLTFLVSALFCLGTLIHFRISRFSVRPHFRLSWVGVMIFLPYRLRTAIVALCGRCAELSKQSERQVREEQLLSDSAGREAGDAAFEMRDVSVAAEVREGGGAGEAERPSGSSDDHVCRICREGDREEELISPCSCSGSLQHVHRTCLDRWRVVAAGQNPTFTTNCELCKQKFIVPIGTAAITRAILVYAVDGILLFLVCIAVCAFVNFVSKLTLGEMECLAPYHRVDFSSPFNAVNLAFGAILYACGCSVFLYATHFVFLQFHNDPQVRRLENQVGAAPPFWTLSRRLQIIGQMLWALGFLVASGYMMKVVIYAASDREVWNWEWALASGALLGVWVGGVVLVIILLKHAVCGSRSPRRNAQRHSAGEDANIAMDEDDAGRDGTSSPYHSGDGTIESPPHSATEAP